MKICPKCRYLDHEKDGPHYECPKCGVIYSKAQEVINEEKRRRNEQRYEAQKKATAKHTQVWTWDSIKSGPKSQQTFWVWAGLIAIVMTVTGLRERVLQTDEFAQVAAISKTPSQEFITKIDIRSKEPAKCPIKIISNGAPHTIFIFLDNATREKEALFFVRTGEEIEAKIPPGRYTYQMIQGKVWFGDQELFGAGTAYLEGDKIFDFFSNATGTSGNTIMLQKIDGNMHPRPTGKINIQ